MKKTVLLILTLAALAAASYGQVFKLPDKSMPIPPKNSGFEHGIFAINQDCPCGVFVEYPKDGESMNALKQRLTAYILPMFMHDTKGKDSTSPAPKTTSIAVHKGDLADSGEMYFYANESAEVRVLFYQRSAAPDKPYLYGYFAYRAIPEKGKDKYWPDEKGEGVKLFDGFWKTITP